MDRENNSTENEMITADDITDIRLIQAGYYWEMGYNEFDFTCKIKGEGDVLHMREQRHDDGSGCHREGTRRTVQKAGKEH